MTHPFHVGRDARYTGAATVPTIGRALKLAAALVAHHPRRKVQIDPMFRALDAHPCDQPIDTVRLVPISFVDFYPKRHDLPHMHELGPEEHAAGHSSCSAGDLHAGAEVAVPAAGGELRDVQAGASGHRGRATEVEGAH